MAMHPSAKKRIRRNDRVAEANKKRMSQMRTFIRKIQEAVAAGDVAAAEKALRDAQPKIQRAGSKGLIHKKTAARKVSRLTQKVKAIKTK
jgi:small subunit ribosomal protein S20